MISSPAFVIEIFLTEIHRRNRRVIVPDLVRPSHGPAARFLGALESAGFPLETQQDLNCGLAAYNSALRVWNKYESSRRIAKVGRNDPCPCGSGRKYKKCCLELMPEAAFPFGPDLIPRLWSIESMMGDLKTLGSLLERDPNLKTLRFSAAGVRKFLRERAYDRDLSDRGEDAEDDSAYFDRLAVEYVQVSGESAVLDRTSQALLLAAETLKTPEQLRAVAAGLTFLAAYEANGDVDNPLTALIFRCTAMKVFQPAHTVRKVVERLKSVAVPDKDIAPASERFSVEVFAQLNQKEKRALRKFAEEMEEDLWECIDMGQFPVHLPFATILPFWFRFHKIYVQERSPQSDQVLKRWVREFRLTMTDDDYRLYAVLLDKWLSQNHGRKDAVSDAVHTMHLLTQARAMTHFVQDLFWETCRGKPFVFMDEEEARVVKGGGNLSGIEDYIMAYADFLESRGYPLIAARTRALPAQLE